MCRISIYQAERDHERARREGRQAQYRMTRALELFCKDCGEQVLYAPAVPFPPGGPTTSRRRSFEES